MGKWGEIKTLPIHTRLTCSFGPGHSLNRLNVQVGGKDFSVGIARVAVCKNKEAKNGWGIEEENIGENFRDVLVKK